MYTRKVFSPFIVFFAFSLIFFSCKKDPNSMLGSNLHPDDEILQGSFDTAFDIIAYTVSHDSLWTQQTGAFLLGSVNDNTFGRTEMNFVGFFAKTSGTTIPEGSVIDSIILTLSYSGTYPSIDDNRVFPKFNISISELDEYMPMDSIYFSNYLPKTKVGTYLLKDYEFTPKPFDTILDSNSNTKSSRPLRLKLNNEIGTRILNLDRGDIANVDKFLQKINGLYIKAQPITEPNAGSVFSFFSEKGKGTDITIYYKYPSKSIVDGVEVTQMKSDEDMFTFIKASYTQMTFDRTMADPLLKRQIAGDTSVGQQRLYLQSGGGAYIKFKLPNIESLKNQKIVINQASLVLTNVNADESYPSVHVPASILPYYMDENRKLIIMPDNTSGSPYNKKNGEYRVYLTHYIQQTLFRNDSAKYITLTPNLRYFTPNQVVVFGPSAANGKNKMRLEVIYTKIP